MRADTSMKNVVANVHGNETKSRGNDYVVPPLYVRDLKTAFAAYFLDWFTACSDDHIIDVVERGLQEGGIVDEIEYFRGQCEADVDCPDNDLGYWPVDEHGPWIFNEVSAADTAEIILEHTRGWSAEEYTSYGDTVAGKAAFDAHIASLQLGSSLKRE